MVPGGVVVTLESYYFREFEPRRGESSNLFAKKKKRINCWERLAWVSTIRRESTREELKSSRDKNARHEPYRVGGKKSLLCDPGSELRIGGREEKKGEDYP